MEDRYRGERLIAAEKYSLRCELAELACLCSFMGARHLVGLPTMDSSFALEVAEIGQVQVRLEEKGLLIRDARGALGVMSAVQRILSPMISPTSVLTLSQQIDGSSEALVFYWQAPNLVQLRFDGKSKSWKIELLLQLPQAFLALEGYWRLPHLDAGPAARCQMPQASFDGLQALVQDGGLEKAEAQLMLQGLTSAQAQSFLGVLLVPSSHGTLCTFERLASGWAMDSLSYLAGGGVLWRARPCQRGNEPWLELGTCRAEEISERTTSLLRRLLKL